MNSYPIHLKALIEREHCDAYQRCNYLTNEWQGKLWRAELERQTKVGSSGCLMERFSPRSVVPPSINPVWREKICTWKYHVVDKIDIEREIVYTSMYYLDRYLSKSYVDEELFPLVAATCIYLAIKLHSHKKVSINCIASMGHGMIHPDHIVAMELSIIRTLDWHLHPPTPMSFIEHSFPLVSGSIDALDFARYLSELSVFAAPLICITPSTIAIAANLIAIDHFGLGGETLASFRVLLDSLSLNTDAPDVIRCSNLLRKLHGLSVSEDSVTSTEKSNCQ